MSARKIIENLVGSFDFLPQNLNKAFIENFMQIGPKFSKIFNDA